MVEVVIRRSAPAVWAMLDGHRADWERVVDADEGRTVTVERKLRLGVRVLRTEAVEAVDGAHCRLRVDVVHVPGFARAVFRRQAATEEAAVAAEVQALAERSRDL